MYLTFGLRRATPVNSSFVRSNILLLLVLVVQVVGFGVLWGRNSEPETIYIPTGTPDAAGANAGQSIPITAIKLPDSDALHASVRAVLQEELRAYVHQANGRVSPREVEAARIAQNPKGSAEAFAQSSSVIDQA